MSSMPSQEGTRLRFGSLLTLGFRTGQVVSGVAMYLTPPPASELAPHPMVDRVMRFGVLLPASRIAELKQAC